MESVAKQLESFINLVDKAKKEYDYCFDLVHDEDVLLQRYVHAVENANGARERNQAAKDLQYSRKERRRNKDVVENYELINQFFQEEANKKVLNKMRQLLGKQREREKYLNSERVYIGKRKEKEDDVAYRRESAC